MAVTRIKNNQITDATVVANAKLVDYSISSAKLANNLTYQSNLTITGNLTVQGNATAIDTTITTIEDPVIVLASTQTSGAPAVDIGFMGYRGNQSNIAFVWDESGSEFVTAFTSSAETNTTITITSYADFHTNNANIGGNIVINGTTSLVGNIVGPVSFSGNITGGNLLTSGLVSATGNVTGGNLLTGGQISATGNVTGGNIRFGSGIVTGTGNIYGGNIIATDAFFGNIDLTGDITVNSLTSNTFVSATGNVISGNVLTSGQISATSTITGGNIATGGTVSATGNVTGGNILTGGLISATGTITSAANVTGGNILTGGVVSATGNLTAGNLLTPGLISAAGLATSGNVETAGYVSAAGNVIADNVNTDNVVSTGAITISTGANGNINLLPNGTGNVVLSNTYINGLQLTPQQDADAASKYYVDIMSSTGLAYHEAVVAATTGTLAAATGGTITYNQPNGAGNGIGATLTTTGTFTTIDNANVQTVGTRILVKNEANAAHNGVYVYSNATVITRSTDADEYGANDSEQLSINDYFFVSGGNVNLGSAWVIDSPTGVITFGTSNIVFAQFSQAQVYSANVNAGLVLVGQEFSAKVDNNTTAFDGGGNIIVKAGANLTTPNIGAATGSSFSATGNIQGGNILTGGFVTATGNVSGGNVTTAGVVTATGTITGGNVNTAGAVSATGDVTGGNVNTAGAVSATGNVTGGNVLTGGLISATGAVTSGGFTTTGNVTGGNILFGSGIVSGTGNVYATNFIGNISGNIDAGGANTEIQFNDDNVLAGSPGFTFNKVGNVITANGNINGANLFTGGTVSATGNILGGNLILAGAALDTSAGSLTVNSTLADADFAVNGTAANVFYVDAGSNTASFGASTQVTNAIVNFAATTSIKVPVGNTAQRPGTGVTGMVRFNTTNNNLELYDNTQWTAVGVPVFTVIADEQFNGDGSTVAFTLATSQTTNSCIVSINGVVQIPTSAYSVSGTTLTFTEAPLSGDLIDVREITTTTTVTSISNSSGNAVVAVSPTAALVNVTGDLSVSGSILGGNINSTAITNGNSNVTVVSSGGNVTTSVGGTSNVMVVSSTDVTVNGNLTVTGNATLSGNILGDRIQNGTTIIDIQNTGGNANIQVGGTANVAQFTPTSVIVGANILPTANITYDIGSTSQRFKDLWLSNSTIYLGNSQISANATALILTNPAGGQTVLSGATTSITGAVISVTGNITGGNLSVGTGTVTTGNIVNANGNGVGNIGSSSTYFNTVFAKATSAQYADLAEKYTADADYEPGTVVMFGGSQEVTVCSADACRRVAGVISTNPSYIMNGTLEAAHVATVALTGRVPTKVTGTVRKGDLMVSAGNGTARAEADPKVGTVIGKALADHDGASGVIEVVVGRF